MIFLLTFLICSIELGLALDCYQCSAFPREPGSQDEPQEPCPGQNPLTYPEDGLYDACMAITLANGTVVAQNAINYRSEKNYIF